MAEEELKEEKIDEEEFIEEDQNQALLVTLSKWQFLLTVDDSVHTADQKKQIKKQLLEQIQLNNMASYYRHLCKQLNWKEELDYNAMKANADKELKLLDLSIEDATANAGEVEVRDAKLARANYLAQIGEKQPAIDAYNAAIDATAGSGEKLDIVFKLVHIGLLYQDWTLIAAQLQRGHTLAEKEGDWERRNLLSVYRAVHLLHQRDFAGASRLLLSTVSTFTCYALTDYNTCVFYTVLASILTLDRPTLKTKIVESPEVLSVVRDVPNLRDIVQGLYHCEYANFFKALARVSVQIKQDPYLSPHLGYYLREVRIVAYAQFLESYSSVTLESMARSFNVSVPFLDRELSRFIAAGRLNCKIDKVSGVVETNRPDAKNTQYVLTLKQGDALLNKIQKLSKIIHY